MGALHEADFYSWTQEQASLLREAAAARQNAPAGVDWENLAQEIWELGLTLELELYHRYVVLLAHLLKWRYQPRGRGGSWRGTIREQRFRINRAIRKNPSLKLKRLAEFREAYAEARELAADESGLPASTFPEFCPFSLEQAEDSSFRPNDLHADDA